MNSGFKQNRAMSFAIIALIYLVATWAGFAVYRMLAFDWRLNLLLADVAATVVTFTFSVLLDNASVYDPYWSVQPMVILAAFAPGRALTPLRLGLLVVIMLWGGRLTANWAYTFHGLHHQDWRYTLLRERTGSLYPLVNFVGIHMVPTLVVYACTLPAVHAFLYAGDGNPKSAMFLGISLGAVLLQGAADCQMHRFRQHPDGAFIHSGLWKYSRHPNYLGEILMWWGVALAVMAAFPHAWSLALGAVANTFLFLTVSIPLADGHQAAKPGFEEYKQRTRMLLPIKK